MDYMEVFLKCIEGEIDTSKASELIRQQADALLLSGKVKEYEKAVLCLTYFIRYRQYNTGKINGSDLMLFLRDFVLYVGRVRFPRLIQDAVRRDGSKMGLFVAGDGAVDATVIIPEDLKEQKAYIEEVYSLSEAGMQGGRTSFGDDYIYKFTKFKKYRSLEQKVAVHSAINLPDNYTLIISLPTGGGKSLVTQLLAATEAKLTLAIVPTVSLAKDQCLQAKSCITDKVVCDSVFCYRGDSDNSVIISGIKNKTARLIFTSPEAVIRSLYFNNAIREAAKHGYLHNIVIDEAHIVPDWGVHFRPDFQIFSVLLNELQEASKKYIRTYLLSATLSDDVVDVLFSLFGSDGNNIQYRCDALRPEPRYIIKEYRNYDERVNAVIEMIKYMPKPLIIYVIEPDTANKYCKKLRGMGFTNVFSYTGDTSDTDREILLEKWKANEFDVMIATSAFGMGVDKSNVRTVVHACVPENLSRFYQEVGRGGRDGLPSLSIMAMFTSKDDGRNDLSVAFGLVNKSILKKENLLIRLDSILKDQRTLIEGDIIVADLNTVPNSFTDDEAQHAGMRNMLWNANTLLLLHRKGYIRITHASYDAQQKTYFFTFKMLDVALLYDKDRLGETIASARQNEYDMRVSGHHKMADIVHRPRAKCWGRQFVSLFPLARPICSGCPAHEGKTSAIEDSIRIRLESEIDCEVSEPSKLLKRHMGPLTDLLVPINDYRDLDIDLIGEKAKKLNVSCVVYPDGCEPTREAGCLFFSHSEFIAVASKVAWIMRNGLFIILSDNANSNNMIFEAANKNGIEHYRKIWCCKIDTLILSRNKTIHDFLNCRTCNLETI